MESAQTVSRRTLLTEAAPDRETLIDSLSLALSGQGSSKTVMVGHAGLHIGTRYGGILCDPWLNPAFFASWFVFPDNSGLDWDRYGKVDYLYVSHLHRDHFDPVLLSDHVSRDVTDFPAARVRPFAGEVCRYEFAVDRPLIERLVADHQTDWVNSLFLSMRFRARRIGPYNEYLYTFFKCLAPDRLMYAEGWFADQSRDEQDIHLDDWIIRRRCPHLRGDLSRFGEISGTTLTCTMHGWQFDLPTGRCLATGTDTHRLRSRPAAGPMSTST